MKAMNIHELVGVAGALQTLVGAQLQEVLMTNSELGLAFYHDKEMLWLWFDLDPLCPLVLKFSDKPPPRKKVTKPLQLFLKSNFAGKRLSAVQAKLDLGRVLSFRFFAHDELEYEIDVRLFPHGQNILAKAGTKTLALNKPKGLPPRMDVELSEARSWEEIQEQWQNKQSKRSGKVQASSRDAASLEKDWQRTVEKKDRAVEKMQETLRAQTEETWALVGEWLKANRTLNVPSEWHTYVDLKENLAWNIERCFQKQKENRRKREGTEARLKDLQDEIHKLRLKGPTAPPPKQPNLLEKAEAKGRRLQIEDLEIYIGKSAADNLALLRRAQPFDFWLHLRDQPGAHAILRRVRNRNVTDHEFMQAGRWLVEQSLHKSAEQLRGEKHDLLIVECRYVRPINGDKLGRVHYTHDRVLRVGFS